MDRETMAFGVPVVGLVLAMGLLAVGLYQGGLTALTVVAGIVGVASITLLAAAVAATA